MLSLVPAKPQLICEICSRVASCCNYGVSSCNACKMFFRRAVVFGPTYTCRKKKECFTNIPFGSVIPNCQACRYQKCIAAGMTFAPRKIPEFFDAKYSELTRLICQLMSKDVKRSNILLRQYTSENINLREMVEKRSSVKLVVKNPSEKLTTDEWTFIYTFSTADFLMSLNFMQLLESADKVRLIESYAYKASMAFYAMRSMNENSDKYVTPDGGDGLPKVIVDMFKNSKGFCERLRSLLITKFIELKITNEELLILLGVFFCNPAVPSLSDHAKQVVTSNQMIYCQSLLQLCLHTHQQSGPSRFMNLLSLCHVIDRNYEQLQSAAIMCVLNKPDYQFPRIIDKVFDFPDSSGADRECPKSE